MPVRVAARPLHPTVEALIATTALVVATLVPALVATRAAAQESGDQAVPAHIAFLDVFLDGTATLERDGQIEAASLSMPIVPGDRLRTTAGRVALLFSDATALDVDEDTAIDVLSPTLFRL